MWAVPLAGIGLVVPALALAANVVMVDRWANAPGTADDVESRVGFVSLPDGVTADDSPGEILFVTITGPRLNALQWLVGNHDNDVAILDREEKFGKATPNQEREIALQMMRDAKDVAEYVAYRRLGFGGTLEAGEVVVSQVLCLNGRVEDDPECDTVAPAGEFLERGATITAIDGTPTPTMDELGPVMAARAPGDVITVTFRSPKDSAEQEAKITTIAAPDDPARALIGFASHDTFSVELPFEATIDTDRIGGPSAGLAFTLTLIDELTPGSLTGGKTVAVTGAIAEDGTVGAIGGLHQKVIAVKQAGADYFIVPLAQGPEQLADARKAAGKGLEIIAVSTLEEALAVLLARGGVAIPPPPAAI